MGATRLYNYLYSEIIGKNEVGGKVAVLQYPVFGFKKSLIDGTTNQYVYTPIGLYTIGADKGDKHTFGYDSAQYENSVMHLEGADHTPKSVGFDYPYEATKFSSSAEAMGAINTDGTVIGAWEVGMAGKLENNVKADEEGVQEMLDAEWKPAYNVAYHNSPYVMGVSETIASINANVDEWRKGKTADGKSYTLFEIYNTSDYALHYYDIQTKQYKPTEINVLTDVGLTASAVSGMSLAEIDAKIIELRKARFVADWGTYFHTDDAILHYTFCLIFGVTDNFKKNTYPYKFPFLANGGKWRWRVDDLDTLFDVINQGLATKQPDILVGDTDATDSIYVGDTSVLWTLIKETQGNEIKAMAHKIFSAMVSHPLAEGANTQAKLVGCIKHFFWDFAQNYFPASAYNVEAEWTYEDTWANKNSWKEVNPLSQALGGHFEAERDWVTMRMLFMSSYFNFGAFTHTGYNDASTGQMVYGGADAHTFEITPAVSINPTIIRGSTETITYGDRVKANETASITVSDASGDDTRVYVQGLDYIKDLGDLKGLKVSAKNPTLSVASKRLQSLKVGDADASKVPTSGTISNLSFGDCPSLMVIDAQNLGTLTGIIDLSLLPRLREALFGGTNVKSINLPSGSKIERLQIPSSVTNLELIRCNNLQGLVEDSNFVYNQNAYIRTDYGIGSTISLTPESGSGFICTVIDCTKYEYFIISGTGYGWERLWCFVDEDNKIVSVADSEITVTDLELKVPMNAKKLVVNFTIKNNPSYSLIGHKQGTIEYDTLPNVMTLRLENNATIDGFSILKGIYSTNNNALRYVRIVGFDYEGDANDVMMIANLATDKDKDGNYHSYNGISSEGVNQDETIPVIEGRLKVNGSIYEDDGKILKQYYPNLILEVTGGYYVKFTDAEVQRICAENWGDGTGITKEQVEGVTDINKVFDKNSSITSFNEFEKFVGVTFLRDSSNSSINGACAFSNCTSLEEIAFPTGLVTVGSWAFYGNTALAKVKVQNNIDVKKYAFYNCSSLKDIDLSKIKSLGDYAFYNCAELDGILRVPLLTGRVGYNAFRGCAFTEVSDLGQVEDLGSYANWQSSGYGIFQGMTTLKKVTLPDTIKKIGESVFKGCTSLEIMNLPKSIVSLGGNAFYDCVSFNLGDIDLPNLESMDGERIFGNCKGLRRILNLGKITTITATNAHSTSYTFCGCTNLKLAILPETITTLGTSRNPWAGLGIETIICKAITPPSLGDKFPTVTNIYVPDASVEDYKGAANWISSASRIKGISELPMDNAELYEEIKEYIGEIIAFEDANVAMICANNFDTDGNGYLTKAEVEAVTDLGNKFAQNKEIASFDELKYFTKISELKHFWTGQFNAGQFYECSNLVSIELPNSVTYLGMNTFSGCTSLNHLIANGVTSMGGVCAKLWRWNIVCVIAFFDR